MMDDLRPMDLHASATALGVHPFEVVRLMVLSGARGEHLQTTTSSIEVLREFGEVETWWGDASSLPSDDNPARRVVRGMLDALLQRDRIGERTTRLDNLWRGLGSEDSEIAEQGVMILHELGFVASVATPSGVKVSIQPDHLDAVRDIVSRGNAPEALAALWTE